MRAGGASSYRRREPQKSLLHETVRGHLKTFLAEIEQDGSGLPRFVMAEFERYLRCGILANGFARVRCIERLTAFLKSCCIPCESGTTTAVRRRKCMDWLKGVQEAIPWLAGLRLLPKSIITALIVGAATFVLVLIWTPPPEVAVAAILKDCYRRALFTRMHAQINVDAMFSSIRECRIAIQKRIPEIRSERLRDISMGLLETVEQIERAKEQQGYNADEVNKLKLGALHRFRELAKLTGGSYALPKEGRLGEGAYFKAEEADAPLSLNDLRYQQKIDPETGATIPDTRP